MYGTVLFKSSRLKKGQSLRSIDGIIAQVDEKYNGSIGAMLKDITNTNNDPPWYVRLLMVMAGVWFWRDFFSDDQK